MSKQHRATIRNARQHPRRLRRKDNGHAGQTAQVAHGFDNRASATQPSSAVDPRLVCPKVLVIDDEVEIVDGAVLRLHAAGLKTITANEGVSGLRCAREHQPDLILLDMRMPQLDGLHVLQELRGSVETRHIPVIMLSASLGDRQRSLHAGARLFLAKPYDGSLLIDAVQQVITEARTGTSGS